MKEIFSFLVVSLIASQKCLAVAGSPPVDTGAVNPLLHNVAAGVGLAPYDSSEVQETRKNIVSFMRKAADETSQKVDSILEDSRKCDINRLRANIKRLIDAIEQLKDDMKSEYKDVKKNIEKTLGLLRASLKGVEDSIEAIQDAKCKKKLRRINNLFTDLVSRVEKANKNFIEVVAKFLKKSKGLLNG